MGKNQREHELWRKWYRRERLSNAEMEEALALEVGVYEKPPAEDDPRYPTFLYLWAKCARFETDQLTREEAHQAMDFGIRIPYPPPTDEQIARRERQLPLLAKRMSGEPWTPEECEIAVETEMYTREEVDDFVRLVATLRARGYEPLYGGALECEAVRIDGFPRTAEDGYEIPGLLTDIMYRGKGMNFVDRTAEQGRHYVKWIGRHRRTGKLVARTDSPYYEIALRRQPSWWEKVRRLFGAPLMPVAAYRRVGGAVVVDSSSLFPGYDTPDYECVWLE